MSSLALLDDFVDTGLTGGFTFGCDLQLRNLQAITGSDTQKLTVQFGDHVTTHAMELRRESGFFSPCLLEDEETLGEAYNWSEVIEILGDAGPTTVGTYSTAGCEPICTAHHGHTESLSITVSGFRLGSKFSVIAAAVPQAPYFWLHYERTYHWFSDEGTTWTITFGSLSASGYWLSGSSTPPDPEVVDEGLTIGHVEFGAETGGQNCSVDSYGRFTGLPAGSVAGSPLVLSGSTADMTAASASGAGSWDLPNEIEEDLDVFKWGSGSGSTGATVIDTDGLERPVPITGTRNGVSPGRSYVVKSEWAADQDPPWRSDDLNVPLFTTIGNGDPADVEAYSPVTIRHLASVDVHRPDGNTPSSWMTSDALKITVAEGASSVFTVAATGAHVTRAFGAVGTDLPVWRRWLGVGTAGHADALFNPDLSETTNHNASGATGQDIFGWESYGFLRLGINAPSAGTLVLTIAGVHLSITDPHTTGAGRAAGFSVTETPFSVTYDVPLASGANTVDVDLLRPASGGTAPFYLGRVDSLQLSGFAVGTYTLSALSLQAVGSTYWKLDWGPPVQRQDYSALGWSNGGAHGAGGLGDTDYKPDEVGASPLAGGNLCFVNILTGDPSGETLDTQLSLDAFLGKIGSLEGWTYSYDTGTFDAANTDAYSSSLAPENAQNIVPHVPYQPLTPGEDYHPNCYWVCRKLTITNAITYKVFARWNLGHGGLEAVALQDGARAPAGSSVSARRTDTLATVASGVCDAYGYVCVSPIPANGSVSHELVES